MIKKNKIIIGLLLTVFAAGLKAAEANHGYEEIIEFSGKVQQSIYAMAGATQQVPLLIKYLEKNKEALKSAKGFAVVVVVHMSNYMWFNLIQIREILGVLPEGHPLKIQLSRVCGNLCNQEVLFKSLVTEVDKGFVDFYKDQNKGPHACELLDLHSLSQRYPLGENDAQALGDFLRAQENFKRDSELSVEEATAIKAALGL